MQADPPDAEEMRRNALIDRLQGTPNPLLQEAFMGQIAAVARKRQAAAYSDGTSVSGLH